jgi:hypothetical protein
LNQFRIFGSGVNVLVMSELGRNAQISAAGNSGNQILFTAGTPISALVQAIDTSPTFALTRIHSLVPS